MSKPLPRRSTDEGRRPKQYVMWLTSPGVEESTATVAIRDEVLDGIAERVASILIMRLGDELRCATAPWMRTYQAAEYLGVTRGALYSRISEVPHPKVGRLLLFNREDLDDWLAQYRREPGKPHRLAQAAPTTASWRRTRARQEPVELLPVGPKRETTARRQKPKRERPLPPPAGGDESHKQIWAYQLKISREVLDAMSPAEFKRAWSARSARLKDRGVFDHIGELMDKLGSKAVFELSPSQLIKAVNELEQTRLSLPSGDASRAQLS